MRPRPLLFSSRRGTSALEGGRAAGAPEPGRALEGTEEPKKSAGHKAVRATPMGGQEEMGRDVACLAGVLGPAGGQVGAGTCDLMFRECPRSLLAHGASLQPRGHMGE